MKQFKILKRFDSPQVKRDLMSSVKILLCKVPHILLKGSRLRSFGNYEIFGKTKILLEEKPSV